MRAPLDRNSPINQARKDGWLHDFVGYRTNVNQGRLEAYLAQFKQADQDLGARVLDCVEFFGPDRIANAYRTGLAALPGWSPKADERPGRWVFAPMSPSAGDSGGTMLHQFRLANGMAKNKYNKMFVHPSALLTQHLGADDTVVLLDDFVGTGKQVSEAWAEPFSELLAGVGNVYLIVVAARRAGRERIQNETELMVHFGHELIESDNLFSDECLHFTAEEKASLRRYCKKANKKEPAGFGDCGLLVVFAHRCPNDSVAVLHESNRKWKGLFPRNT